MGSINGSRANVTNGSAGKKHAGFLILPYHNYSSTRTASLRAFLFHAKTQSKKQGAKTTCKVVFAPLLALREKFLTPPSYPVSPKQYLLHWVFQNNPHHYRTRGDAPGQ